VVVSTFSVVVAGSVGSRVTAVGLVGGSVGSRVTAVGVVAGASVGSKVTAVGVVAGAPSLVVLAGEVTGASGTVGAALMHD